MAIAMNYRKHPEALAIQLPLPFSRLLVWALPRPTTRILRAIRAARGAAFKAAGRVSYPSKITRPAWVSTLARKVRELGQLVQAAQVAFDFATGERNAYARRVAEMRKHFEQQKRCPIVTTI